MTKVVKTKVVKMIDNFYDVERDVTVKVITLEGKEVEYTEYNDKGFDEQILYWINRSCEKDPFFKSKLKDDLLANFACSNIELKLVETERKN